GGKNFETTPYKLLMGERKNSWFGFELDGGKDINGDGEPDLVVGAPYGGKKYAGSLYIYISGNFEKPALVIEGTESGELFGSSVDIDADLTGDLINDIVVGAYYSSPKGKNTAGRVYIYNGGSIIAPTPAKIIDGERDGGWFGFSLLLCGDINGDGVSELVVSAPKDGEGKVFVYSYADISKPVLVLKGAMENESFGYSLSVCGDINGDGFFDLIVGSPANFENGYRCGKAYIFLTGKTMDEKADYQITGRNAGDELGYSLGFVPEYWGKGKNIILVGLPATEANKSGSVQIYR
ncbi:MAG: integrin alpha, partial [bacterium]